MTPSCSSSVAGDNYPEELASGRERHEGSIDGAAFPPTASGRERGGDAHDLWLPDEFWASHPKLAEIRRVAISKRCSPDAVLDICLGRVGAVSPHGAELPADGGMPMALGMYVSPIGGSGGGKSTAMKIARCLVPAEDDVADPISPGSGETIPDALFGFVEEVGTDGKKRQVRRQTRHNGIVEYSEGSKLFEQTGRSGSTLTSVIRQAFTNDTIGEDLVDKSRARKLLSGEYVLSVIIGFQPEKAAALFEDAESAAGTPQRFVFSCPARSESHVLGARETPCRGLPSRIWSRVGRPFSVVTSAGEPAGKLPLSYPVEFCAEALDDIERIRDERSMFGAEFDPLDAHEPVVLMKTAACLALLLDEKYFVSVERWHQARVVYERSRRVRRWTLDQIRAAEARIEDGRRATHVRRQRDAAAAVETDRATRIDAAKESWVNGAARVIRAHASEGVHPADDPMCRRHCLNAGTSGARRKQVDVAEVEAELVDRELAIKSGDGAASRWAPGPVAPLDGRSS